MQHFKKFKRVSAWVGAVGAVLSGVWWIGVYVHQGWELVNRYV
jgi:apolipoprotein N-acyltransferase